MDNRSTLKVIGKIGVFLLCLLPFVSLAWDTYNNNLGANPIETLHFRLGDWALRMLCLTLALTPFKIVTGFKEALRYRRMLGLYSFFYASLHLLVYIVLDLSLSWQQLLEEIPQSPYIIVGLLCYCLLLLLTLTSTQASQKLLRKNWKRLHRLVYPAACLALLHYFWLVKSDYREPLLYAAIIALLFSVRLFALLRKPGATLTSSSLFTGK